MKENKAQWSLHMAYVQQLKKYISVTSTHVT